MKNIKRLSFFSFLFLFTGVNNVFSAPSESQLKMLEQLPPDQRASIMMKMETHQQKIQQHTRH